MRSCTSTKEPGGTYSLSPGPSPFRAIPGHRSPDPRARRPITRTTANTSAFRSAPIRSYLRDLGLAGLLIRTHGGAIARTKTGFEPDAHQKEVQNLKAKRLIARAALALVEDGDTIVLDTGTTTLELARFLTERKNLTVVTNDLVIAQLLEENASFNIVLMGGVVRKGFHCTVGVHGRALTNGLTADKAFMAANGFTVAKGATTPDINHAETKKRDQETVDRGGRQDYPALRPQQDRQSLVRPVRHNGDTQRLGDRSDRRGGQAAP